MSVNNKGGGETICMQEVLSKLTVGWEGKTNRLSKTMVPAHQ